MHDQLIRQKADLMLAEEHEKLNRLIDDLRERIAVVPRSGRRPWIERLEDCYSHFEAHFVRHMALEEQGGYLAPVLEERPTLAPEVARLKHEHDEFLRLMESLRHQVRQLDENDSIMAHDCCCRTSRLLAYIEQHEHEEDLLLIDGVSRDIGVKD